MHKILFYFALLSAVVAGCGKKTQSRVAVFVDFNFADTNWVMLDDTTHLELTRENEDLYVPIFITEGKHKFTVNNDITKEFTVKGDGGILNLAEEDFVIYPIKYTNNEMMAGLSFDQHRPVVIDSTIIYEKTALTPDQDAIIAKFELLKHGYKKNKSQIDKSNVFIERAWDFGVDEDAPDQMEFEGASDFSVYTKLKVMPANLYYIGAILSGEFNVEKIEPELDELLKSL